ncbi:ATP-dependent RNA helicase glh-2-like isoform X2 [Sabethes cyaneus]|uniref:ATP-dependent RNA helicase glh-2-like isoform X2 n=1 Tax=Sabethes cyaneus TaxID=53552 RepID=UPI00237D4AB1|nr:ATP-dependent RNA helicase glh-2-like isoform X2 [Sabethes cyaneus]
MFRNHIMKLPIYLSVVYVALISQSDVSLGIEPSSYYGLKHNDGTHDYRYGTSGSNARYGANSATGADGQQPSVRPQGRTLNLGYQSAFSGFPPNSNAVFTGGSRGAPYSYGLGYSPYNSRYGIGNSPHYTGSDYGGFGRENYWLRNRAGSYGSPYNTGYQTPFSYGAYGSRSGTGFNTLGYKSFDSAMTSRYNPADTSSGVPHFGGAQGRFANPFTSNLDGSNYFGYQAPASFGQGSDNARGNFQGTNRQFPGANVPNSSGSISPSSFPNSLNFNNGASNPNGARGSINGNPSGFTNTRNNGLPSNGGTIPVDNSNTRADGSQNNSGSSTGNNPDYDQGNAGNVAQTSGAIGNPTGSSNQLNPERSLQGAGPRIGDSTGFGNDNIRGGGPGSYGFQSDINGAGLAQRAASPVGLSNPYLNNFGSDSSHSNPVNGDRLANQWSQGSGGFAGINRAGEFSHAMGPFGGSGNGGSLAGRTNNAGFSTGSALGSDGRRFTNADTAGDQPSATSGLGNMGFDQAGGSGRSNGEAGLSTGFSQSPKAETLSKQSFNSQGSSGGGGSQLGNSESFSTSEQRDMGSVKSIDDRVELVEGTFSTKTGAT